MASKTDKFLVLACDPDEGKWSVIFQSDSADDTLDFWQDNPEDPSPRIAINTADFITFDPTRV